MRLGVRAGCTVARSALNPRPNKGVPSIRGPRSPSEGRRDRPAGPLALAGSRRREPRCWRRAAALADRGTRRPTPASRCTSCRKPTPGRCRRTGRCSTGSRRPRCLAARRPAAADYQREHRQHAAGARRLARPGDGAAHRARGAARPHRPAAGHRQRAAGRARRRRRAAAGRLRFAIDGSRAPLRGVCRTRWRRLQPRLAGSRRLLGGVCCGQASGAGFAPAFYAFRADINALLKRGGGGVMRGRLPLQRTLIVGQIAVSLALLIFGGLFAKTLTRARETDLGFRTANVLVAHADLSSQGYDQARRLSYSPSCTRACGGASWRGSGSRGRRVCRSASASDSRPCTSTDLRSRTSGRRLPS